MNITRKLFLGFVLMAATLAAQLPTFTGVVNPASNLPPGFPNAGIAQGSIFVIYGSSFGAPGLNQATTLPFPTTAGLGGTVVTITVGGTTVTAPMVYVSPGQVAAVLPSNTPVGTGTLSLTYNQNTGTTPITVVQSNFGISTVNDSGSGPAVVTFANYSLVTTTNSAKPGDTLILWGTGLGALPAGQSDASGAQGPLAVAPSIQVLVGGVPAQILYQARTPTAVGLDQINFVVPANAPLGCNVGIVVQTTTPTATVSNAPTMSIASADGVNCTDPVDFFPPSATVGKSSINVVGVGVKQSSNVVSNGSGGITTTTSYKAQAFFFQFTQAQLATFNTTNVEASLGSCFTQIYTGAPPNGNPAASYLSAGGSVVLTPPAGISGNVSLASQSLGTYQTILSSVASGTWGFSNGTGGTQVPPVTSTFPVPQSITWTNETSLATGPAIDRTQPLTIMWSGGDSNGYVDIEGQAQLGPANSPTYTIIFDCSAPNTATQFTIPSSILLAMPTGANALASLQVSTFTYPTTLAAIPNFNVALNNSTAKVSTGVTFK